MKKTATAQWSGDLKQGNGIISTESGAIKAVPYSFHTRFENEPGTNPEELIGAAHAGCFSMAFSGALGKAGFTPVKIETKAEVTLEKSDSGFSVTSSHLIMKAKVPNIDKNQFDSIANDAKANCPISKLLNAKITLDATLESA